MTEKMFEKRGFTVGKEFNVNDKVFMFLAVLTAVNICLSVRQIKRHC